MAGGSLAGHHALVTGGSRGIGRAIAAALAAAGATVTVLGRDAEALDAVVQAGEAHGFAVADVQDRDAMAAQIRLAAAERGPIDLLVANAGAAVSKPFLRTAPDDFAGMWSLNVMGVVHAVQATLGAMQQRGFGRIVAVASTAGLKGYPYVTAYCAAKHAVLGLVRSLALETARTGVTVNAVCPGFADTDLVTRSLDEIVRNTGRSRQDALSELTRHNPQGRLVAPSEVADAVLWLCGERAGSVTGQAVAVAGGEV
ncbi:SDR family NAD(P)-dependent oxidoreductase [uncultured Enterovirga sp.]|uniref:SDR family NAD(P)-dependent oxidoreductase n=1 Tax=uncultured Enterovirga sp. TaxID=2026352 RepID=UPI0035C9D371